MRFKKKLNRLSVMSVVFKYRDFRSDSEIVAPECGKDMAACIFIGNNQHTLFVPPFAPCLADPKIKMFSVRHLWCTACADLCRH